MNYIKHNDFPSFKYIWGKDLHLTYGLFLQDLSICSPTGSAFSARSLNPRMTANRLLLNPLEFVFASTYSATHIIIIYYKYIITKIFYKVNLSTFFQRPLPFSSYLTQIPGEVIKSYHSHQPQYSANQIKSLNSFSL